MPLPDLLTLLIVEDDAVDRLSCRRAFRDRVQPRFTLLEADNGAAGLALLAQQRVDCILLDYHLPDQSGLEFLAQLGPDGAHPPVMMLTGTDSAAVAADAMRNGARDYLVKDGRGDYLARLPEAVLRMLREQRLLNEARETQAMFRTVVEQMQAISYVAALRAPYALSYISPQIDTLGYSADEWLRAPGLHAACMDDSERADVLAAIGASRAAGTPLLLEYRLHPRAGQARWFRDQAQVVRDEDGAMLFMQGLLVDITSNKLAEAALLHSHEALRKLAAHQESIKENERKRIAQEIHDELGGLLTGIKAYIAVASADGPGHPLLGEAAGLAQEALDTVRRVITDLRPSVLDQLGVWEAIDWCGEQAARRANLRWHSAVTADAAARALGPGCSTMLFRIVQEGLTNVVRHAGAGAVELAAWLEADALLLRLSDDGRGIDAARLLNTDSWGILGMQERAGHFGGTLTLRSAPQRGTTLLLTLPLENAHA